MDIKQIFSNLDAMKSFLDFLVETGPPVNENLIEVVRTEISDSVELAELKESERTRLANTLALMITRHCNEALQDKYRLQGT